MKKTNKKLITLLLGGMLGVATLGAGLMKTDVVAADEAATAKTYTLTDIFASNYTNVIGAEMTDAVGTTTFSIGKGENVEFRRNLALKWFDEVDGAVSAQYFTAKFALANTNFDALSVVIESESATANADNKATNKVTFAKLENGNLSVAVNGVVSATEIAAADVNKMMTLTLSETDGADYGTFNVLLNGTEVGTFENIGANYAAYTSGKVIPFAIANEKSEEETETTSTEDAKVYLYELNNQKFDNVVEEGDKKTKKVLDTAAPVIVINDDIADGLLIGTAFAYYSPTVIDVLPNSDSKITTRSFYQWNPTDTAVTYNTDMKSSHYFMDTTYYLAADGSVYATKTEALESGKEFKATTVYKENNEQEFLSVKYVVQDDSMEIAKTTKEYQLAWYAEDAAKETKDGVEYVYLNKKNEGATYSYIQAGWTDDKGDTDASNDEFIAENHITDKTALKDAVNAYQTALAAAAQEAIAGSNSYIYFPSLAWLIQDNNGYRNLKFVICYKSPSSTTGKSTSTLSYNGLRLSTTDEGYYEFKVYATDAAGNGMYYYLDGELVKVTASNIWDIEEIPSFSYTIERKGVSIKNDSDTTSKRQDDVEFNGKFSGFSDPTVVGMTSKKSAYALYKVDTSIYNDGLDYSKKQLTYSVMSGVTYKSLKTEIDAQFKAGNIPAKGEYFDFYLDLYVKKLGTSLGATSDAELAKLKSCFIRIDEYDSSITEDDAAWETNKFKWNASSKSFEAVEDCEYIIFADYYESDLATQRVAAYKVIEVEAEEDVNYIKTKWIKDNITSVILFAIAGVLFVMIIVLLLIKPSDETLDEIEEEADEKKDKKKRK
ncbi:MAG: hypothetical protein J6C79_01680 [Clostridia bacterium]|nr:hypothetical protein [Clostridia bacterium]